MHCDFTAWAGTRTRCRELLGGALHEVLLLDKQLWGCIQEFAASCMEDTASRRCMEFTCHFCIWKVTTPMMHALNLSLLVQLHDTHCFMKKHMCTSADAMEEPVQAWCSVGGMSLF